MSKQQGNSITPLGYVREYKSLTNRVSLVCYGNRATLESRPPKAVSTLIPDGSRLPRGTPCSVPGKVVNNDTLLEAKALIDDGFSPVVLNMANARSPGGGFRSGAGAQEENLHRRSNLEFCLLHEVKQKRLKYPIPEFGVVYTPKATVFRSSEEGKYAYLSAPFNVAVLSAAAYNRPSLGSNTLRSNYIAAMKKKVQAVIRCALHYGHDAIVLGAWGCGAFKNPPEDVARVMAEVVAEEAGTCRVHVAIIEDYNSRRNRGRSGISIIDTFRDAIESRKEGSTSREN
uniref:Microbial-type PARG catalytic domain-containing protein n=1 Tax=Lotharella oceanica TaxID=641309 RepID=A0A7S2TVG9_9EUKA|mmetsp:Transcript_28892/g.54111  ORF Transcript_28892/g.54111 Transcript_28892/m.54111 type:complete len:286 (+) Transcript_28892:467-1324(+)